MRLCLLTAAAACMLVLGGCSSDSGKEGGAKGVGPADFNPNVKPSNPASQASIAKFFSILDNSSKYHPSDEALFSEVISGSEVTRVDQDARQNALNLLSPVGKDLTNRILQNCRLNPATKSITGERKPNSNVSEQLRLSSEGGGCNFLISMAVSKNTQYAPNTNDESTGWFATSLSFSSTEKNSRTLNDDYVMGFSNLKSTFSEVTARGTQSLRFNSRTREQSLEVSGSSQGQIRIVFANGQVLEGPTYSYVNIKASSNGQGHDLESIDVRSKFEGRSSEGSIHWMSLRTNNETRTYVNGELIGVQRSEEAPIKSPFVPSLIQAL